MAFTNLKVEDCFRWGVTHIVTEAGVVLTLIYTKQIPRHDFVLPQF